MQLYSHSSVFSILKIAVSERGAEGEFPFLYQDFAISMATQKANYGWHPSKLHNNEQNFFPSFLEFAVLALPTECFH